MIYAVRRNDGTYTGTHYHEAELNDKIREHHARHGDELVAVKGIRMSRDPETRRASFTVVELTEQDAIEAQKKALKAERDAAIRAPFVTGAGHAFDVAEASDRENITGALEHYAQITAAAGTETITWTLADGTEAAVDAAELQEVVEGFVLRKAAAYATYQAAKAALGGE